MVELLLVVCLAARPEECREIRVQHEPYSFVLCLEDGPLQAIEWAKSNPGYTVKRWRCREPRA